MLGQEFYTDLFKEKESSEEARAFLKTHITHKLSTISKDKLNTPLTVEELIKAAKQMARGKSSDLDGLPVFY
jgi:hypothetical protein